MSQEDEIKRILDAVNSQATNDVTFFNAAMFLMKPKRRGIKTSELIIQLITKSIVEQKAIEKEDIVLLYWLYKSDNETKDFEPVSEFIPGQGWGKVSFTKETFCTHWRMQRNAVSWFKAGLASAILEGNLLVLPIIKIQ